MIFFNIYYLAFIKFQGKPAVVVHHMTEATYLMSQVMN